MKTKNREMSERLRNNQQRNLKDYQKQSEKADKRIEELAKITEEQFVATKELRKKHLKAKTIC